MNVGFIGAGKMAQAMAKGFISAGKECWLFWFYVPKMVGKGIPYYRVCIIMQTYTLFTYLHTFVRRRYRFSLEKKALNCNQSLPEKLLQVNVEKFHDLYLIIIIKKLGIYIVVPTSITYSYIINISLPIVIVSVRGHHCLRIP